MTPNLISTVALFAWPIIAIVLYRTKSVAKATLWTILGALMFLPTGVSFKFPMIPEFEKGSISNFSALIGCLFIARQRVKFVRQLGLAEILILVFIFSPVITSELNTEPVRIGDAILPGVGIYDGLSAALSQFVLLLPFFLGRQFLRTPEDNVEIFRVLVVAGLVYSLPMLFELRMSPVLNIWIYGYSPAEMQQNIREGGFRPVVFMGHGLAVAYFTMTTVVAAATLWRLKIRLLRLPPAAITSYLGILLILCKSGASLVYGTVLVPLIRYTKPRWQLRVALVLTTIALLYPILRSADLVPTSTILNVVASFSEERAGSLKVRFDSEQALLEHAQPRILFGWGRFGRSRLGNVRSDGAWIIILGEFGVIGFIGAFGLLALPIYRAASALKYTTSVEDSVLLAALSLIVAVKIFDLVPNSGLDSFAWLMAGALLGRVEVRRGVARRHMQKLYSRTEIQRPTGALENI